MLIVLFFKLFKIKCLLIKRHCFFVKNYRLRPNPPRLRPKPERPKLLPLLWPKLDPPLLLRPNPPLRTGPELLRVLNERCDREGLLKLPLKLRDDMADEVVGLNVLTVCTRV